MHNLRNNRNKKLQQSLRKLRKKIQNKEIVIDYSDKDGKTIIMDYIDYITLIKQALKKKLRKTPTQ